VRSDTTLARLHDVERGHWRPAPWGPLWTRPRTCYLASKTSW
jgi:hypothetical protein